MSKITTAPHKPENVFSQNTHVDSETSTRGFGTETTSPHAHFVASFKMARVCVRPCVCVCVCLRVYVRAIPGKTLATDEVTES